MKFIRPYMLIILLVVPIALFVALRAFNPVRFESDAVKQAGPSVNHENYLTFTELVYPADRLIIDLTKSGSYLDLLPRGALHIPAASILDKDNLKLIRKNKLPLVIASDNPGEAARIWMLLSQMGVEPIFILRDSTDNEVLKYEFRPDSTIQAGIQQ
jgi:hypothetical protein